MKARFYLLPATAFAITVPVYAALYMSVEPAQVLMLPGMDFTTFIPVKEPAYNHVNTVHCALQDRIAFG
jgi:hypothetical protein